MAEVLSTNDKNGDPSEAMRRIVTGVREFYLGVLSKNLTLEDIESARSATVTRVAEDVVLKHFLAFAEGLRHESATRETSAELALRISESAEFRKWVAMGKPKTAAMLAAQIACSDRKGHDG